jgi:hypothetical protein
VGFPRFAWLLVFTTFALIASCGGESIRTSGDAGEAGEAQSGSAGSVPTSGQGGSATTSGGAGGNAPVGGAQSGAGTGGAGGCGNLEPPCAAPYCPEGEIVNVPCGCSYCSCDSVDCALIECDQGYVPVRPDGACCDVCMPVDNACDTVMCGSPPPDCPTGRSWRRPAGACCAACVPDEPPSCPEIACNPDLQCAPGFVVGDGVNGCCFERVPDPLYCVANDDCVVATKPSGCCSCPEVISRRLYDEDKCWVGADDRPVPLECSGDIACDVACAPCPNPGEPWCVDGRCTGAFVPPPK